MKTLNMINKYICSCKKYDFSKKKFTYWEDRKTTSDEIDVLNFIKENFDENSNQDKKQELLIIFLEYFKIKKQ